VPELVESSGGGGPSGVHLPVVGAVGAAVEGLVVGAVDGLGVGFSESMSTTKSGTHEHYNSDEKKPVKCRTRVSRIATLRCTV
jgi:hypothetical protein